jgi:hypothetical protein
MDTRTITIAAFVIAVVDHPLRAVAEHTTSETRGSLPPRVMKPISQTWANLPVGS